MRFNFLHKIFILLLALFPFVIWSEVSLETQYILNNLALLFCAALIFWMGAGFCMLEVGLVRSKSSAVICVKNICLYAIACICYYALGYNLMYSDVGSFIGELKLLLSPSLEELSFLKDQASQGTVNKLFESGTFSMTGMLFQMTFVAATASIISGALAERLKLWPFFIVVAFLSAFIYPIQGAWTWGGGWLSELGFKDFAGSSIVHSVGGWVALTGVFIVGPRKGRYGKDGQVISMRGSNLPLTTLGTFILWLGWFGFNGGSQLAMGSGKDLALIGLIFFNTNISASAGVLAALLIGLWLVPPKGKVNLIMILNGAIAGLVSITASPDISSPLYAVIIGFIGGGLATLATPIMDRLKLDDVVGAIPAHLVAGVWGTLAVAIFGGASILTQLIGILAIGVFCGGASLILWIILKRTIGLRLPGATEDLGQDIVELGQEAYPEFLSIDETLKNEVKS